ncbi:class I SAM-dependent methyltransferase [Rugamonas apoptosis]|uniref:class I SAM-dependent methyltransferase n=1 Tax=Rugamonas apoptosis TaxID=2758570 RepID=UPI001C70F903|nr:class I SAM-dependent methyltransferase [Rugamonas apoptosis]
MSQTFYRAFEDRYRGSRELIKHRLGAYRPFLLPLVALDAPALDLGCGRGEWLELLAECGLQGRGVDLDAGMLAACRERGLNVALGDALAALRAQPDASLALVSAFHLVEHLPFALVQELITESRRALLPGGLLILETPNPENLTVGAASFYLDPTHERPLPPALLEFAVDYGGFERHRVVRLQEDPVLHDEAAAVGLITVLEGVSPDYAVVAQRAAAPAVLAALDAPFGADYGVGLGQLAQRYEQQQERDRASLHRGLAQANTELDALRGGVAMVAGGVQSLVGTTDQLAQQQAALHAELSDRLGRLEARGAQLEQRIIDMLNSRSWRVTAPLRWATDQARAARGAWRQFRFRLAPRQRARALLLATMRAVLRRPRFARAVRGVVARFPALQARLYSLAYQPAHTGAPAPIPESEQQLSPRAQHAYQQLQQALAARKKP